MESIVGKWVLTESGKELYVIAVTTDVNVDGVILILTDDPANPSTLDEVPLSSITVVDQ